MTITIDNANDNSNIQKSKKLNWHIPFYSSLELELNDYLDDLEFKPEYMLNNEPIRIDMLIKKNKDIKIDLSISEIFKQFNIIEFKSPDAHLGINEYHKVMGYYNLFMSYGFVTNSGKSIKITSPNDVTISFVRYRKPKVLINHLINNGYTMVNAHPGIYRFYESYRLKDDGYDTYNGLIIQVIELKELSEDYKWLKMLSKNVTQDALDTIDKETELSDNISKTNRIVSVGAFVERIVCRNALDGGDAMNMTELREHLINLQKEEIAKKDKEIAEKDSAIAEKDSALAKKDSAIAEKDNAIAEKDSAIAEKDEEIRKLKEQLKKYTKIAAL